MAQQFEKITELYHEIRACLQRESFHDVSRLMQQRTAAIVSWKNDTPTADEVSVVQSQTNLLQDEISRHAKRLEGVVERASQMTPARLKYEKEKFINLFRSGSHTVEESD